MNIKELVQTCWEIAETHGFHEPSMNNTAPSWVANLHGEVSEFWEAYRKGSLCEPCNKPIPLTCAEEELADIVIRACDVAAQMNIDLERAINTKCEYNKDRPYKHGGKKA